MYCTTNLENCKYKANYFLKSLRIKMNIMLNTPLDVIHPCLKLLIDFKIQAAIILGIETLRGELCITIYYIERLVLY